MKPFDNVLTQHDSHIYSFLNPGSEYKDLFMFTGSVITTIAVDDVRGYIYWNQDSDIYCGTINGSKSEKIIANGKLYMCIYIIK